MMIDQVRCFFYECTHSLSEIFNIEAALINHSNKTS